MVEVSSYQYSDGSGNRYLIRAGSLEYVPVRREESSSLVYSGGTPAKAELIPDDFDQLREQLETLLLRTELHIENRVMMSGVIVRESPTDRKEAILRPGSREILAIETQLNKLLRRK